MEHQHPRALHLTLGDALMSTPPLGNLASEMAVLDYADGNQSQAAEILGITRTTLRKKLRSMGLPE